MDSGYKKFALTISLALACAASQSCSVRIRSPLSFTSNAASTVADPSDHLVLIAGDTQNASAGSAVAIQPKVQVVDSSGNPVSGVVLTFTVTGGGGSVGAPTVTTDALGFAETSFTLGAAAGANTMTVARQGTALPGVPSTLTFTETSKLVNLEVPITMLGKGLSSENGVDRIFSRTQTQLTTTDYDGTVTYSFEVIALNSDAVNRSVELVDALGITMASISVSSASAIRQRVAFTPNAGQDFYRIRVEGTTVDDQLIVHTARMIVKQVGATKTRIYIPLLQAAHVSNATGYAQSDVFCAAAQCENNGAYVLNSPGAAGDIIWAKNSSIWKTLSGATPWTFEATLYDGNASTGKVSLVNNTTSTRVAATELTESNSPGKFTYHSVDFADNAANFTDGSEFSVRSMDTAANFVAVDHAGLWVRLSNLQQGEVYYPVSTYAFYFGGLVTQQRVLYDASLFSNPLAYFEANGYGDLSQVVDLYNHGTNDSGSGGASAIVGSTLTFNNTGEKVRQRSAALTLTSGDRYLMNSNGSGGANGSLIVGFSW